MKVSQNNILMENCNRQDFKCLQGDISRVGEQCHVGISALSKMPTSGLDYEAMSDEEKRQINNLPAMLYHGVRSEEAVLMRMNSAPRSIAESLGTEFKRSAASTGSATQAADFLRSLSEMDWDRLRPKSAAA